MEAIRSFKRVIGLCSLAVTVSMLTVILNAAPALAGRQMRIKRLETRLSRLLGASDPGNCLQDNFTAAGNTQTLSCTANDVRVAEVKNIRNLDGTPLTTCNAGTQFSFLADFTIVTSSQSSRSNVGLYFATQGQSNALTGQCTDSIIAPKHPTPCGGTGQPVCLGSDNYHELDPQVGTDPDNCGDTSSSDVSPTAGAGAEVITIKIENFLCEPPAGSSSNQLVMNDCTSWQVPGKTNYCYSPPTDYPYEQAAIPGSPSKCNCSSIPLGITAQTPSITVTKNCSTANGAGTLPTPSCTLDDPGGTVTYTVDVKNTSIFGSLTLNQICDSAYGNVVTATTTPPQSPCSTGTVGTIASAGTCTLPQTIAANGEYSCTFTADQAEDSTVNDTVAAKGVGQNGTTPFSGNSNEVTVTAGEAESTASTIKTSASASPSYGCATVRYGVEVDNTSASTSDETETLKALTDSYFGNIAVGTTQPPLGTNVLGTTCGVATGSPGQGTLSGSTGAGVLPATIDVGGNYACQFDAKVCGNTGPLVKPPNATDCTAGIENTDTVSGTIVGDESETVTQQTGKLTVDVCFSVTEATATPTPAPTP
jgi:hypothetical protein